MIYRVRVKEEKRADDDKKYWKDMIYFEGRKQRYSSRKFFL